MSLVEIFILAVVAPVGLWFLYDLFKTCYKSEASIDGYHSTGYDERLHRPS